MSTKNEKGMAMQVFEILFIFVLAFVCVVVPTLAQGAVLVGEGGGNSMGFEWDPLGYFSFLFMIAAFFAVLLAHSVKNYKY